MRSVAISEQGYRFRTIAKDNCNQLGLLMAELGRPRSGYQLADLQNSRILTLDGERHKSRHRCRPPIYTIAEWVTSPSQARRLPKQESEARDRSTRCVPPPL